MPLTVDDLVGHLNMPTAPPTTDARYRELQRALNTATQELVRMTGRLDATTATARVSPAAWTPVLALPYVDLAAVGMVTDPAGLVVTPRRVDLLAGIVYVPAPASGVWSVVCTGNPWPSALEAAALDWAAHVYDTQRTTLNPTADEDTALPSFALPNRVAQFARPYLLPGVA